MKNFFHHTLFTTLQQTIFLLLVSIPLSAQEAPPEEDIRGPRDLIVIAADEKYLWWPWLYVSLGIIFIAVMVWLFMKWRQRKRAIIHEEVALKELRFLAMTTASMDADSFVNRASSILRQYVTNRFGIAAPRRTTEEFLAEINTNAPASLQGRVGELTQFLKSCDVVKFASGEMNLSEREFLVQTAKGFIIAHAAEQSKQLSA